MNCFVFELNKQIMELFRGYILTKTLYKRQKIGVDEFMVHYIAV